MERSTTCDPTDLEVILRRLGSALDLSDSVENHNNTGLHKSSNGSDRGGITTSPGPRKPCLFLDKLPGEIRTIIYEYVLRKNPAVIVVDLRKHDTSVMLNDDSFRNLLLACRGIYEECSNIRYDINKVHIFVPVFSTSPDEREIRDLIASRLREIADSQVHTKQLRRARLFLGRLPRLSQVRWTEFFNGWMSIRDSVMCLSTICLTLELSFEIFLAGDVVAQHKFRIATRALGDTDELFLADGSIAETTDAERERFRKIKATIAKTTALSSKDDSSA